jgi:hypothetical protein
VLRRFLFYLIGVGFGVIASMLFFGDRDVDFSYLPNARTVKHLRNQNFKISDKAQCQLRCVGMNESSFEKVFRDADLDVNFGDSDVDGHCKTYLIEVDEQKFTSFTIDDCDSLSTLLNLEVENCNCN